MAIASIVIGENAQHLSAAADLLTGLPLLNGLGRLSIGFIRLRRLRLVVSEIRATNRDKEQENLLHKRMNLA